MRYYKVVYERKEMREVWMEVDDNVDEDLAKEMFWNDFDKYDGESDEFNDYDSNYNIVIFDEIDENGDDL